MTNLQFLKFLLHTYFEMHGFISSDYKLSISEKEAYITFSKKATGKITPDILAKLAEAKIEVRPEISWGL